MTNREHPCNALSSWLTAPLDHHSGRSGFRGRGHGPPPAPSPAPRQAKRRRIEVDRVGERAPIAPYIAPPMAPPATDEAVELERNQERERWELAARLTELEIKQKQVSTQRPPTRLHTDSHDT